jgi:prepilin-type N-terminal cleavage/methylation domain-containing protein/prepilin-type processing-associated H-X9-DG protein
MDPRIGNRQRWFGALTKGAFRWQRMGFTLIELLVVIAIIGILAAMLFPVLSSAKKKGAQAACINNQQQLGIGMKMYVDDNNNTFPGIASRLYGFHPSDWIYWRTNTIYPQYPKSPILTSIPGLQKPSLRCPLDTGDADRLSYDYGDTYGPYLFSYSFNGYGLDANNNDLGMSSVMDTDGNVYLFKEGAVHNPGNKIMLAEEPGSLNSWDSPNGQDIINDGRWVPGPLTGLKGDLLTIRHGGKADVTFGDGHVQAVTPEFGADTNNTLSSR